MHEMQGRRLCRSFDGSTVQLGSPQAHLFVSMLHQPWALLLLLLLLLLPPPVRDQDKSWQLQSLHAAVVAIRLQP
jgi:hypothetical protein